MLYILGCITKMLLSPSSEHHFPWVQIMRSNSCSIYFLTKTQFGILFLGLSTTIQQGQGQTEASSQNSYQDVERSGNEALSGMVKRPG